MFTLSQLNMQTESFLGILKENYPLAPLTRLKVGGKADIFFAPKNLDDLKSFLCMYPQEAPLRILGACSNIIVADQGIRGAVIKLGPGFNTIKKINTHNLLVGAAVQDFYLAQYAADNAIGGLSFFCGIPGTIGGALAMNAGCYGQETKDIVSSIIFIDKKSCLVQELNVKDKNIWNYRSCNLDLCNIIFLQAHIDGFHTTKEQLQKEMRDIQKKRTQSQPFYEKTAGSTFRNPNNKNLRAWRLIDQSGCRDLKIGGASMSKQHANFMTNDGTATANDCVQLGEIVRQVVFEKTQVLLEWEVQRIGEFFS